jgi:hypothetical protein
MNRGFTVTKESLFSTVKSCKKYVPAFRRFWRWLLGKTQIWYNVLTAQWVWWLGCGLVTQSVVRSSAVARHSPLMESWLGMGPTHAPEGCYSRSWSFTSIKYQGKKMNGSKPPLPNSSSWCDAQLSARIIFSFTHEAEVSDKQVGNCKNIPFQAELSKPACPMHGFPVLQVLCWPYRPPIQLKQLHLNSVQDRIQFLTEEVSYRSQYLQFSELAGLHWKPFKFPTIFTTGFSK